MLQYRVDRRLVFSKCGSASGSRSARGVQAARYNTDVGIFVIGNRALVSAVWVVFFTAFDRSGHSRFAVHRGFDAKLSCQVSVAIEGWRLSSEVIA